MHWPEPMAAIECKLRVSNLLLKIQTDYLLVVRYNCNVCIHDRAAEAYLRDMAAAGSAHSMEP